MLHGSPQTVCGEDGTHELQGLGMLPLAWLYDNYLPLLSASVAFSFLLSSYLYATSFGAGKEIAVGLLRSPVLFLCPAGNVHAASAAPTGWGQVRQCPLRLLHRP